MMSGKEYLFEVINSIDKSEIRQLKYKYEADCKNIEKRPVVFLRKKTIDTLLDGNITENKFLLLKEEIDIISNGNVFKIWSNPYRVLYTCQANC